MLRHFLFIIILLISSISSLIIAQCPVSVLISSTPDLTLGPVCKGTSIQLTATPSIGVISPQYTWIVNGDTLFGAGISISLLAQGQSIQLFMNSTTGCPSDIDSASTQIQVIELTGIANIVNRICIPPSADIDITTIGGSPSYNYDLISIGSSSTGTYFGVPSGSYSLAIVDNNGCRDTNQISIDPKVLLTPAILPILNECNQEIADFQISTTGGTPSYTYNLQGIGQSSGSFDNVPLGDYILFTTDGQGCRDTNLVSIVPTACPEPSPIEAITPNGDGFNDTWFIGNIQFYPDNKVSIFDRWGQRVYQKDRYTNADGWDGKYLNVNLPVSSYYYVLQLNPESDNKRTLKGAISIFR